jgi:hypothetical protein
MAALLKWITECTACEKHFEVSHPGAPVPVHADDPNYPSIRCAGSGLIGIVRDFEITS